MEERDPLKEIADIRALMRGTATRVSRDAGWFFIVWGIVWTTGFVTTQLAGNASRWMWLILNVSGIIASVLIGRRFFGKRGNRTAPGLASRIALISIGTTVFDILLIILFGFTSADDITLLLILTAGLGYFIAGTVGPRKALVIGVILWCSALFGRLAVPGYLPLVTAVSGGAAFLAVGISFLLRKEA